MSGTVVGSDPMRTCGRPATDLPDHTAATGFSPLRTSPTISATYANPASANATSIWSVTAGSAIRLEQDDGYDWSPENPTRLSSRSVSGSSGPSVQDVSPWRRPDVSSVAGPMSSGVPRRRYRRNDEHAVVLVRRDEWPGHHPARAGQAAPTWRYPRVSNVVSRDELWALVHAERAALAEDLADLNDMQWAQRSLCGQWTAEEVLAHLTAAATTGRLRWLISVARARFDFGKHNAAQLAAHRGPTPAETLDRFRAVITSTTAPSGHTAAWLGEVVVHGQDIRRPLGLSREPSIESATEVARFYASRDFTVAGRSSIEGLRLEATDGPFASGTGPLVSGTTIALTMAMAGRVTYCDDLAGPGLPTLRSRL